MEEYTTLKFNSPTGLVQFNILNDNCIDPNTLKPFRYAVVHGNTWRTTLSAELPNLHEAFTPGAIPELNHRGIYEYNYAEDIYNKYEHSFSSNVELEIPGEWNQTQSTNLNNY